MDQRHDARHGRYGAQQRRAAVRLRCQHQARAQDCPLESARCESRIGFALGAHEGGFGARLGARRRDLHEMSDAGCAGCRDERADRRGLDRTYVIARTVLERSRAVDDRFWSVRGNDRHPGVRGSQAGEIESDPARSRHHAPGRTRVAAEAGQVMPLRHKTAHDSRTDETVATKDEDLHALLAAEIFAGALWGATRNRSTSVPWGFGSRAPALVPASSTTKRRPLRRKMHRSPHHEMNACAAAGRELSVASMLPRAATARQPPRRADRGVRRS